MKTLTLALLLLSLNAFSQEFPVDSSTSKYSFTEVVKVDSVAAPVLFSRAKLFVAQLFNSAKEVTQMEDAASGTIVCKGNFTALSNYGFVKFDLSLYCKDGRYKYSMTNFVHVNPHPKQFAGGVLENEKPEAGTFFMTKKFWIKIKEDVYVQSQAVINKLKATMASKTSNDW